MFFSKGNDRKADKNPMRQIAVTCAAVICVGVAGLSGGALAIEEDPYSTWFFTSEEITAAYQYQQNYGERLRAPLRATDCAFRDGEFTTFYRGARFRVPCRFITEVTRHLKQMLDVGAAAGSTTRQMLQNSPQSRVIAFEPFPGNFPHFERTIGGDPRVTFVKAAVGPETWTFEPPASAITRPAAIAV